MQCKDIDPELFGTNLNQDEPHLDPRAGARCAGSIWEPSLAQLRNLRTWGDEMRSYLMPVSGAGVCKPPNEPGI